MPSLTFIGFLEVDFRRVADTLPKIDEDAAIGISNGKGLLKLVNEAYCFYGMRGNTYKIAVMDDKNHRRVLFDVGNSLVVNNYYHIDADGNVEFNPFSQQNVDSENVFDLKVHPSSDPFKMRIKWCDRFYYFDVFNNGLLHIDPATKAVVSTASFDEPHVSFEHDTQRKSLNVH